MTHDERLSDLLLQWESRASETEVDPDTFCALRGAPDLAEPFRRLLGDLGLFGMAGSGTEKDGAAIAEPVQFAAGRFRAESILGQGGLGVVFRALDVELDRPVALKRLHAGDLAFERFIFEARLTGRLEHPGIVPVYGLVADRQSEVCYAMRLISGVTLNDAIARLHEREGGPEKAGLFLFSSSELVRLLRAFVTACETLAYAHSKRVVHRDLKPQNIMLGEFGECLVIDWGLARVLGAAEAGDPHLDALRQQLKIDSEQTFAGQAKGTWGYMAPEQARGEWERVGAASDIFSLGATLYKLLTGKSPYQGPFDPDTVKAGRITPPRQVMPNLPRPLEAVILKAMAPDPQERYGDARELARDVERWLADEPVSAYRDPLPTRVRRWAKRHRMVVASTAVLIGVTILALSAGLIVVTGKNRVIASERDRSDKAAREAAEAQRRAEKAAGEALAINTFFRDQVLAAPRPRGRGPGRDIRLAEALDKAAPKIAEAFADQPLVEADVRHTLGETYYYLGKFVPAAEQLQRAFDLRREQFGLDHAKTLASLNALANALRDGDQTAKAVELYRHGVAPAERVHGPDGRDTIAIRGNLGTALRLLGKYGEAESELRPQVAAARRTLGPDDEITRAALNDLALALFEGGNHKEAETLFREALEIESRVSGPDEPETLAVRHNVGLVILAAGRPREAEAWFRPLVETRRRVLGPDHADTLKTAGSWGEALVHLGRLKDAEKVIKDCLERAKKALGPDHADTLIHQNNLGMVLLYLERPKESEEAIRDVLERRQRVLPRNHPDTLETQNNLAYCLFLQNRPGEAVAEWREVIKAARIALPAEHRLTLTASNNLAGALVQMNRYAEAEPILREVVVTLRTARGDEHDQTLNAVSFLARALERQGKLTDAEPLFREAYDARRKQNGSRDERTLQVAAALAGVLQALGKAKEAVPVYRDYWNAYKSRPAGDATRQQAITFFASMLSDAGELKEAEPLARENLKIMQSSNPPEHPKVSGAQSLLGGVLLDLAKYVDAEPLLRASLASREKTLPQGHWQTALARVRLGATLAGLKKFDDAEKLLLQGQRELSAGKTAPPGRQREAVRRLVAFYRAWGKADDAARWESELAKLK